MTIAFDRMSGPDWQHLMLAAADAIDANVDELSRLDAAVGDGDHGVNVATAMAYTRRHLEELSDPTPADVFKVVAKGFLDEMGGAAGALFGSLFKAVARSFQGALVTTAGQLADAIEAGCEIVTRRGNSQPGDKTMVDALVPAASAGRAAATDEATSGEVLDAMALAARQGAESTVDMTASRGRARYAEERSIGVQDAGATSVALILEAWAAANTVRSTE
ncbi:MAG: dihydroxyacetone kinase subunit L [bacterium]|nr:dihydroxyacetone kinase subunit L [bacterium]